MKIDEPILGDGEFTQFVLDEAKERLEERFRLQAQGHDLDQVTVRVTTELGIGSRASMDAQPTPAPSQSTPFVVLWGRKKIRNPCHRATQPGQAGNEY